MKFGDRCRRGCFCHHVRMLEGEFAIDRNWSWGAIVYPHKRVRMTVYIQNDAQPMFLDGCRGWGALDIDCVDLSFEQSIDRGVKAEIESNVFPGQELHLGSVEIGELDVGRLKASEIQRRHKAMKVHRTNDVHVGRRIFG